ncbi:MAG: hypothetical protein EXS05_03400 [Planctomycetaceae bacterium]|nr:hypothetical protein [Planctomycetaceae bacterium]
MATVAVPVSQSTFYREFLMGRSMFKPQEFGIDMQKNAFMDQMVDEFDTTFRNELTIDELLLHSRSALRFCDDVRSKFHYFDLPEDIILRSIMTRRKNP